MLHAQPWLLSVAVQARRAQAAQDRQSYRDLDVGADVEPHAGPPADCDSPPLRLSAMLEAIKPMTRGAPTTNQRAMSTGALQ